MTSEIPEASEWTLLSEESSCERVSFRDRAASFLHKWARMQAHLFWWYTERFFSHFFFAKKECCSLIQKVLGFAKKCCLIALAAPLLSCTLLLAETELLTRISAQIVAQKSFTYLLGRAKEKDLEKGKPLTVFSLNTCFVAGGFSLFYGGVAPWTERVEPLIQKIREKDPDILCLQEVNDLDAAYRLYNELKDHYAHFYLNIGPKVLSQNSGLFVASKLAIMDPSFKAFDEISGTQKLVNKGFFDCQILSHSKSVAHLFVTHLSPSSDDALPTEEEKGVRKKELEMIFAKMEKPSEKVPIIFAGDFNIEREQEESFVLKKDFLDPLPKGEKSNATDLLKQTLLASSEKEVFEAKRTTPEFAIDYILFKPCKGKCKAKVSLIQSYDPNHFNFSKKLPLSDHHALLGEFYLRV
jgi:endonuclease/exonuclease/phosphatase family metal-dependent hydrolase